MTASTPPPHAHRSETLHIVYNTDAAYLTLVTASAISAIRQASTPESIVIHILDCGLSDEDWRNFSAIVCAQGSSIAAYRHKIEMSSLAAFRAWHGSLAAYARLFLPTLLSEVDWCLYVDGDTLFTDDPAKVLACRAEDVAIVGPEDKASPQSRAWFAKQGFQKDWTHYFCSGFMLINLAWFRVKDAARWCMGFLHSHPDAPFPDQDALNICCEGHIRLFPTGWGVLSERMATCERPGLIHYVVDLPTKMRFRWRDGFRDVTAVWVNFARVSLGMSVWESCGIPGWQWALGRAYNHALRVAVTIVGHTPFGRRWGRMEEFRDLFIPRKTRRWLLSRRLWTARWHGE